MTPPRWYSQPFPPAGSISAEGIKKTLGKPPIPWPAILVRESAQNSWDARRGDRPVGFTLDLSTVLPQHARAWRSLLLEGAPYSDKFPLRQTLRGREGQSTIVRTLTISDRGTKGLGGPTRADTVRGEGPRDWVSFVLNVGDPPDTKNGGGTYGYGKGVLYQTSRAGTVIVHTRTEAPGGPETRLIGVCLGESVELPDPSGGYRPYTGRHWWGQVIEETYVEPLFNDQADEVAAALGLPAFRNDETGTDVVIVDPDFGDESDAEIARYLADSIAWNLWPIMLEQRGENRLIAGVRHEGVDVPAPVPERTRGLKTFVAAYRRLKDGGEGVETLSCGNPKRPLGRLAIERQLATVYEAPAAAQDLGVTGSPHHVCLMRSPELVVKYHVGPEPISANLAYGGVFQAFDDMDRTYAAAEPPTHDDWVSAQLEGSERTFVRTTFARLKERLDQLARPAPVRAENTRAPLGAVSNFLGSIVAAAGGAGAASMLSDGPPSRRPGAADPAPSPPSPGQQFGDGGHGGAGYGGAGHGDGGHGGAGYGGAGHGDGGHGGAGNGGADHGGVAARASVRLGGVPQFQEDEHGVLLHQRVLVHGSGQVVVQGMAAITVADGTREQEPPERAEQPAVIGWRSTHGFVAGDVITLPDASGGVELALLIRPVPDTVTQVDATLVRSGRNSVGR